MYPLPTCRWCAATAAVLLAVRVCSVCAREKEGTGEIELGLYAGFL